MIVDWGEPKPNVGMSDSMLRTDARPNQLSRKDQKHMSSQYQRMSEKWNKHISKLAKMGLTKSPEVIEEFNRRIGFANTVDDDANRKISQILNNED